MSDGNVTHLEMNGAGESNPILRRCTMLTLSPSSIKLVIHNCLPSGVS
ncbi:MAG: hypothetical protein H9847_06880 [Candidatus Anaerobiospirillum pullicola]|uniref:Uncharacterized protein n=1 Tax=Candidatus Anaerobiospirillum pullicola TaxID=2838451 RepID=A0A948WZ78_9GAMM|nr:hypothetical protein [Candidatus Anaerobiospirillum pullicola]